MQPSSSDDKQPTAGIDDLSRVRELLLGAEYNELIALKNCLHDPIQFSLKIADVISESISLRIQEDQSLSEILAPTIKVAIQQSILEDPQALAESLYPIMGPAIRKSISETLSQMLENMNQLLEQSLSPRSLGWRVDAWRTGRSYSEIALINTLEYQVEQVFLIHNETSLLIQHLVADMAITKDPDMVSSMLSAIQDYIHDSFAANEDEMLNSMRLGDLTVIIEKGPRAILAAVIRGKVPESLRKLFIESLEDIHKHSGKQLAEYSGNPDDFVHLQPTLQKCLTFQRQDSNTKKQRKIPWLAIIALISISSAAAYFGYQRHLMQSWQQMAMNNLKSEPGLLIIGSTLSNKGNLVIRGLRDPLSKEPERVAMQNLPKNINVQFELQPYFSVEPSIIEARANKRLTPPAGVSLALTGTTLVATGKTDIQWLQQLKNNWPSIHGVEKLDSSALVSFDPVQIKITEVKQFLESATFLFAPAATEPTPTDLSLELLAQKILALQELAQLKGQNIIVQMIGSTDNTGSNAANLKIARERAKKLYDKLLVLQIPRELIQYHSLQEFPDLDQDLQERKVIFRVTGLTEE